MMVHLVDEQLHDMGMLPLRSVRALVRTQRLSHAYYLCDGDSTTPTYTRLDESVHLRDLFDSADWAPPAATSTAGPCAVPHDAGPRPFHRASNASSKEQVLQEEVQRLRRVVKGRLLGDVARQLHAREQS